MKLLIVFGAAVAALLSLPMQSPQRTKLVRDVLVQTDSLRATELALEAETNRPKNLTPRKGEIRTLAARVGRLASRIDSIALKSVPDTVVRVDTVPVIRVDTLPWSCPSGWTCTPPPDTTAPDTTTPPVAQVTLDLTVEGGDTLRIRPTTPYMIFFRVHADSGGGHVSDSAAFSVSDTTLAEFYWLKGQRRFQVSTVTGATKGGPLTITARYGSAVARHTLYVDTASVVVPPPPPPPDTSTTPPPPPPPLDSSSAIAMLGAIGPTRLPAQALALGAPYALMDPLWVKWEVARWTADGAQWAGNYYDRCLIYYAMWARTGNPVYKQRGDAICLDYRKNYLEFNFYKASAHWSQLDGIALHYWINGDDSSRIAVGKTAWNMIPSSLWSKTYAHNDGRTAARALTALLLAWQTNAPNAPVGGWAAALDKSLDSILPQQMTDGGWRYANTCNLSLNYMSAMLADALIRVYHTYRPDPRIPPAVKKTADFLWTQWRAADPVPSFNYYEALCSNQHGTGGPTATPDLTGLFTTAFAWMAKQDASYLPKAAAVFDGTMRGMYPQGSKQFNQAFAFSWRALGYLP